MRCNTKTQHLGNTQFQWPFAGERPPYVLGTGSRMIDFSFEQAGVAIFIFVRIDHFSCRLDVGLKFPAVFAQIMQQANQLTLLCEADLGRKALRFGSDAKKVVFERLRWMGDVFYLFIQMSRIAIATLVDRPALL